MSQPIKDAISICKTIMRNGYDAYIINAPLQKKALKEEQLIVDICTDIEFEPLAKIFPQIKKPEQKSQIATLKQGEVNFCFYPADTAEASAPETTLVKLTP